MLSTLIKRAGGVAGGIALGQGIVLLVTPYLARHYPPEAFGALALLMTISNLSTAVACLRYDLALPSSLETETRGLLISALISAGAMAVMAFMLASVSALWPVLAIAAISNNRPLLIASCVLLVGFHQAMTAWLLRRGAYFGVAAMRFSQGAAFSVMAAVPGIGLLWAHAVSFGAGVLALRPALKPGNPSEPAWTKTLLANRKFPLLNLPGAILDVCGYSICVWVIARFYGPALVGNYSQVQRLTGAPLMLVSISVGQILLRQTAEMADVSGDFKDFFFKILRLMCALALFGIAFLWFFGERIFAILLGSQWIVDRRFITLVAVAVFFRACVSPLSTVLITLRRFKTALIWQVAYFCSALLLMPFFASRLIFSQFVAFYAIHEAAFYSLYLLLIYRAIHSIGLTPNETNDFGA